MTVYVAEINGRGIAAFNTADRDSADHFVDSEPFRADLAVLESEGKPLWNGTDDIFIREAFPEEQATFKATQARAIKDEEIEDEDDEWVLFLVPVTDPTGRWQSPARRWRAR
jgi:hypothetical protein